MRRLWPRTSLIWWFWSMMEATMRLLLSQGVYRTPEFLFIKNRGYGANQKTCYRMALEEGGDIIIMIHPDYQYTPMLIPAMAPMIESGL